MSGAVLRLLLCCLLACAIPVQGMAAVGLHLCGGHANTTSKADAGHDHAHAPAHDLDVSAAPAAGDDTDHHHSLLKSGCSACAPCCGVAALAQSGMQLPESPPASSVTALSAAIDLGIDADVLQRPPRISLA